MFLNKTKHKKFRTSDPTKFLTQEQEFPPCFAPFENKGGGGILVLISSEVVIVYGILQSSSSFRNFCGSL